MGHECMAWWYPILPGPPKNQRLLHSQKTSPKCHPCPWPCHYGFLVGSGWWNVFEGPERSLLPKQLVAWGTTKSNNPGLNESEFGSATHPDYGAGCRIRWMKWLVKLVGLTGWFNRLDEHFRWVALAVGSKSLKKLIEQMLRLVMYCCLTVGRTAKAAKRLSYILPAGEAFF